MGFVGMLLVLWMWRLELELELELQFPAARRLDFDRYIGSEETPQAPHSPGFCSPHYPRSLADQFQPLYIESAGSPRCYYLCTATFPYKHPRSS
jgi:hypothetical protein